MSYQIPSATRASGSNSARFVNSLRLEKEEQAMNLVHYPTIRESRDSALRNAGSSSLEPPLLELSS